jgi:hypothetical protein
MTTMTESVLDEPVGILRAPPNINQGLSGYSARSEFATESGALAGDTATVGGAWAGAGDADDFTVASGVATRASTADANINTGRYATLGSSLTAAVVQADVRLSNVVFAEVDDEAEFGVLARYVDTSNWLMATLSPVTSGWQLLVRKRVAGTVTTLARTNPFALGEDAWYTVRLAAYTQGQVFAWVFPQGSDSPGEPTIAFDSALATGGALATGKGGVYDTHSGSGAVTRTYDNFAAWVPPNDAVMFANQSAELAWNGITREDSSGAAHGPVSHVEGDLPRIPVSGLEGRTVEVFVKPTRGDLDQLPDSGIDDVSVRLYYRPSWLFAPES